MYTLAVVAYVILAVLSAALMAMMLMCKRRGDDGYLSRESVGFGIFFGLTFSPFFPVILPAVWLITGFAEHGVWRNLKK